MNKRRGINTAEQLTNCGVVKSADLSLADIVGTTSKVKERDQVARKAMINFPKLIQDAGRWQLQRPPITQTNEDLEKLRALLLAEIEEVWKLRRLEGLPGYDFKSEAGEHLDVLFFVTTLCIYVIKNFGEEPDYNGALVSANGQSGHNALTRLQEIVGNVSEGSLPKDIQYILIQWISYLIHMKFPVNPNHLLHEYTLPKNNGNYDEVLLNGKNPIFERLFNRAMNKEEMNEYFKHYRKATRIIRNFIIKYVDPSVENTGLRLEHLQPYRLFIYNFIDDLKSTTGLTVELALLMLEDQLHLDYDIPKPTERPKILLPGIDE
jgi:hypothetical protein